MSQARVHFRMGNYCGEEGVEDQAFVWYLKAVESDPNLAEVHNNLGIIYKNRGELQKAMAEYDRVIEILRGVYPERDSSVAEPVLSEILRFAQNDKKRRTQNDIYLAQAYDNLGVIYAEMGLIDIAISFYKKAVEADPQNPRAHNNLGVAYEEKGDYEAAIEEYKKAFGLCPELKEAHYNLGSLYGLMGRYEESIEGLEKALELDSCDLETHYNLSLSYKNRGEKWDWSG